MSEAPRERIRLSKHYQLLCDRAPFVEGDLEYVRADRYDEAIRQRDNVIAAARNVIRWAIMDGPDPEDDPVDALVAVIREIDDARSADPADVKKETTT